MIETTVGQFLVNEALPESMRDYGRTLDSKSLKQLLGDIARNHPEQYRDVTFKLNQVGQRAAQDEGGMSFGMRHLRKSPYANEDRKKVQAKLDQILADDSLSDIAREEHIIRAVGTDSESVMKGVLDEAIKSKNPLARQVMSGTRGKPMNLASLIGSDRLYADHHDRTIPIPVLRSYSEGLSPEEYWAGTYGARRGIIGVKFATADAGFLSKQLSQATHRLLISDEDRDDSDDPDPPVRGMSVDTKDDDNEGALLASDVGPYKKNTVLTPKILNYLHRQGHERILVRSPIIGGSPSGGVYARDVGVRETGRLPGRGEFVGLQAAQALGEPVSQGMLSSKHSGGVAGQEKTVGGFKAIDQLVQIPKIMRGGAAHATVDGIVQHVEPAPAGGHFVTIDGEKHYVGIDNTPKVKRGDVIEAGDVLSDGVPNPATITKYKGIGEGRKYFVSAFRDTLRDSGIKGNRRNIELLARGLINHVRLTEETDDNVPDDVVPYSSLEHTYKPRPNHQVLKPSDAVGRYLERPVLHYTIGTKVRPSMLKDMEEFGVNNLTVHDDPPPFEAEMIRGLYSTRHDPDWMTQMYGSGLKSSLLNSTARGATSDARGSSFVPSLALGTDFGQVPNREVIKPKPGYDIPDVSLPDLDALDTNIMPEPPKPATPPVIKAAAVIVPASKTDFTVNHSILDEQRQRVHTAPTKAQLDAGNYRKGHVSINGLSIAIENPKGSYRSGVDRHGKAWRTLMKNDYGYIKRTVGKDGDHVDVFLGPDLASELVFVVDQDNNGGGTFDEHKCMLGFKNQVEAKAAYLANYQSDWKGFQAITPMTFDAFKAWCKSGDTTKPVAKKAKDEDNIMPILTKHADNSTPSGGLASIKQQPSAAPSAGAVRDNQTDIGGQRDAGSSTYQATNNQQQPATGIDPSLSTNIMPQVSGAESQPPAPESQSQVSTPAPASQAQVQVDKKQQQNAALGKQLPMPSLTSLRTKFPEIYSPTAAADPFHAYKSQTATQFASTANEYLPGIGGLMTMGTFGSPKNMGKLLGFNRGGRSNQLSQLGGFGSLKRPTAPKPATVPSAPSAAPAAVPESPAVQPAVMPQIDGVGRNSLTDSDNMTARWAVGSGLNKAMLPKPVPATPTTAMSRMKDLGKAIKSPQSWFNGAKTVGKNMLHADSLIPGASTAGRAALGGGGATGLGYGTVASGGVLPALGGFVAANAATELADAAGLVPQWAGGTGFLAPKALGGSGVDAFGWDQKGFDQETMAGGYRPVDNGVEAIMNPLKSIQSVTTGGYEAGRAVGDTVYDVATGTDAKSRAADRDAGAVKQQEAVKQQQLTNELAKLKSDESILPVDVKQQQVVELEAQLADSLAKADATVNESANWNVGKSWTGGTKYRDAIQRSQSGIEASIADMKARYEQGDLDQAGLVRLRQLENRKTNNELLLQQHDREVGYTGNGNFDDSIRNRLEMKKTHLVDLQRRMREPAVSSNPKLMAYLQSAMQAANEELNEYRTWARAAE